MSRDQQRRCSRMCKDDWNEWKRVGRISSALYTTDPAMSPRFPELTYSHILDISK
jgi:hypothetical protein